MKNRFETFTVLINRISRNIRKIKIQYMSEYNLRSAHISCLYYLYSCEKLTAAELCEKCEEDKATVSRALGYLEENQYIIRDVKLAKAYKIPLILTEKGKLIGKKISDGVLRVIEEAGSGLSDEERITFYRCLSVISNNLNKISSI